MNHRLNEVFESIYFYHRNPHAFPPLSRWMCRMGRHDYEPTGEITMGRRDVSVTLICFFCERRKRATTALVRQGDDGLSPSKLE